MYTYIIMVYFSRWALEVNDRPRFLSATFSLGKFLTLFAFVFSSVKWENHHLFFRVSGLKEAIRVLWADGTFQRWLSSTSCLTYFSTVGPHHSLIKRYSPVTFPVNGGGGGGCGSFNQWRMRVVMLFGFWASFIKGYAVSPLVHWKNHPWSLGLPRKNSDNATAAVVAHSEATCKSSVGNPSLWVSLAQKSDRWMELQMIPVPAAQSHRPSTFPAETRDIIEQRQIPPILPEILTHGTSKQNKMVVFNC